MGLLDIDERLDQRTLIDDLIKENYGNVHRVFPKAGLRFLDSGWYGRYCLKFYTPSGFYEYPLELKWKQPAIAAIGDPGQPDHIVFYTFEGEHRKMVVETMEELTLLITAIRQECVAKGWVEE
jgi:hypothetical protein